MQAIYGYVTGWAVYLAAGVVCYALFHRFTGLISLKPVAYCLRAIMLALILTPWYVAPDKDVMAPALMVIMLDVITLGGTAFVRAFVPLLLAVGLALALAIAWSVLRYSFHKRQHR